jgi:glutathione S-transferase
MKIRGRANSINVMKVLWTADERGLKYERTDVGLAFGGNDQKWYLDMNPNGVVPTIDDGAYHLGEQHHRALSGGQVCRGQPVAERSGRAQ